MIEDKPVTPYRPSERACVVMQNLFGSSLNDHSKSILHTYPLTHYQTKILDSSKMKEFADDNFKFDKNGRKLSKWVETLWEKEKLLITSSFSLSHCVFKMLVSQGCQKMSLCGNGLKSDFLIVGLNLLKE